MITREIKVEESLSVQVSISLEVSMVTVGLTKGSCETTVCTEGSSLAVTLKWPPSNIDAQLCIYRR